MDLIEREQPEVDEDIQTPTEDELKDFRSLVNEWIN